MLLDGKTAIVTGAARGNGRGIAKALARDGANVYCLDLLKGEEPELNYYEVDLANSLNVNRVMQKIFEQDNWVDILVNNAGISLGQVSQDYELEKWNKTIQINLTVPFLMSQIVARQLIKCKAKGSIINITSLGAELGFPDNPAYCASKGGLKQLGKALAYDWAQYNIRVNNVGPGYMHTNMTDKSYNNPQLHADRQRHMMLDRWGEPDDLGGICCFLASEHAEYITGQDIYVDGGWTAKGL